MTNKGVLRKSNGPGVARLLRSGGAPEPAFINEFGGLIEVVEGTLQAVADFEHRDGALIGGNGTFTPPVAGFIFDGDVGPGMSIGRLNWDGDYEPSAASELQIELGSGGASDVLSISGAAQLGGGLRLSVVDGYTPMVDDEFTIITAGSFSGAFDEVVSTDGLRVGFGGGGGLRLSITHLPVGLETVAEVPSELRLHPAYPNPSSRLVNLGLSIPEPAPVEIRAYDLLGRQVAVLWADSLPAGIHSVSWDVSRLPQGAYFVRLLSRGETRTQQIVVVH
jgi:hypothetical protein